MSEKPKQVFLWYGDNDLEIMEKVANWKNAFAQKHGDFNIVEVDFSLGENKDKVYLTLKNGLTANSLFGNNKLIVLKNYFSEQKKISKEVNSFVGDSLNGLADGFFLIFCQVGQPLKSSVVFKKIKKLAEKDLAEILEISRPKIFEMDKWLNSRAKKHGAVLTVEAKKFLLLQLGNDLWAIDAELAKLAHYKKGENIEIVDVKEMVVGKFNEDIFSLMDAISSKEKKKALILFSAEMNSGADEFYMLSMFVRQFRLLWQAKEFYSKGIRSSELLAKEMAVHPFVAKKILTAISGFEIVQIKKIYQKLLELDRKMKSQKTNFRLAIESIILEI